MIFKGLLKKIPFVRALASFYRKKTKKIEVLPGVDIKMILDKYSSFNPNPFFVTVGANEGILNDHFSPFIFDKGWKGLLIEPVGKTFENLKENFKNVAGLQFLQVGVSDEEGTLPIYKFADDIEGSQYHQLFSFEKKQLLILDVPEDWKQNKIVEELVPIYTLSQIFNKQGIEKLDLLQIDTEGFDYKVLLGLDFSDFKPDIVVYEHVHLKWDVYFESIKYMRKAGYLIYADKNDTLAVLPKLTKRLGL
jgi:FkbM family methyltransferase